MSGLRRWGEEGSPEILLLHCTLAHGGAWTRVARRLSQSYHLVAPDMVGHGQGPEGHPSRDYHDQVTEHARNFLGFGRVHLVGHSFGATVALRLAIEAPERVCSLTMIEPVLFAAAPDGPEKRANARTLSAIGPMVEGGDMEGAARRFLSVWGSGEPFDALTQERAAYMARRMWIIPAQQASLHGDGAQLLPRLDALRCPALLLQGGASPAVIGQILDTLEAGLPRAERAVIDGAGHMAPVTHPVEVAERIGAFLRAIG